MSPDKQISEIYRVMATRIIKILLALSAAAWGLIGGIRNLYDYPSGVEFAAFLLSVEGTDSIRGLTHPIFAHIGYAFVWISKFVTCALCALGAVALWYSRLGAPAEFSNAKEKVYLGIGISIFMLFFGFMVVVGALFAPSQISEVKTLYFEYTTFQLIGLGMIMLFLNLPEREL